MQVLSTMNGLGMITPQTASYALHDVDPAVQEFAVRLCEPLLRAVQAKSVDRKLATALVQLVEDKSIRVRYQLALTLGEWNDPRAAQALGRLAVKDPDWAVQTALLSSAKPHANGMLNTILGETQLEPPAELLAHLLNLAVDSPDSAPAAKAFKRLAEPSGGKYAAWQIAATATF